MKRNKLTYIWFFFMIILLPLFSGCTSDTEDGESEMDAGTIYLTLSTPSSEGIATITRGSISEGTKPGEDHLNENTIHSIEVFFFDSEGKLIWKPETSSLSLKGNTKLEISVPSMRLRKELSDAVVQIYVLVNHSAGEINQLDELKQHVIENASFLEKSVPQQFVMLGNLSKQLHFVGKENVLGNISLVRLASKIESKYPTFPTQGIKGYNALGEEFFYLPVDENAVEVRLHNIYTKSHLDISSYLTMDNEPKDVKNFRVIPPKGTAVFYSYSGEWKEESKQTYLEYRIQLKRSDSGEVDTYYYAIPIAGDSSVNPKGYNKVNANHHYFINPVIGQLGSTIEKSPIWLNSQFIIQDWSIKELSTSIVQAHYFMLKEHEVYMANTDQYKVQFVASSKVRTAKIKEVWYYAWRQKEAGKKDLESYKEYINSYSYEYPRFTINNNTTPKNIEISSPIPRNFSPRYITVVFEDEYGFQEELTIKQYPARYITGRRSEESQKFKGVYYTHDYNDDAGTNSQNNFNLFAITTLAGGEEFNGKKYKTGDPTYIKDGKVYTYEDKEHNQLISPNFVVASQRSIYNRVMYNRSYNYYGQTIMSARERCATYGEGGYEPGTWRLPTEAEIEYLNALQNDYYSPIKDLFRGPNYWSGASYRYHIFMAINEYDGYEGAFGDYRTPNADFSNDSYSIYYGRGVVWDGSNYSIPNYLGFADPAYISGFYSSHYYYSAYVRCVRDI